MREKRREKNDIIWGVQKYWTKIARADNVNRKNVEIEWKFPDYFLLISFYAYFFPTLACVCFYVVVIVGFFSFIFCDVINCYGRFSTHIYLQKKKKKPKCETNGEMK